jgi:hypothetical protein
LFQVSSNVESGRVKIEQEGVVSSWSTGIAEIQLPSSYKDRNALETEKAARRATDSFQSRNNPHTFQRFHIDPATLQANSAMPSEERTESSSNDNNPNKRRKLKSTDDLAVEKYKKVNKTKQKQWNTLNKLFLIKINNFLFSFSFFLYFFFLKQSIFEGKRI